MHILFSAFPVWHKVNAVKTSTMNFALIRAYLWKSRLEASGAYPSIRMDTVCGTQQSERWTAVGRKEMQPGQLGNTLIHCIRQFSSDSSLCCQSCYGAPGGNENYPSLVQPSWENRAWSASLNPSKARKWKASCKTNSSATPPAVLSLSGGLRTVGDFTYITSVLQDCIYCHQSPS